MDFSSFFIEIDPSINVLCNEFQAIENQTLLISSLYQKADDERNITSLQTLKVTLHHPSLYHLSRT